MNIPFFDLKRQTISLQDELNSAMKNVFSKGVFIGGEQVEKFEYNFARYLGVNHCISCANGTDAIEMALEVLGIGPGHEVILPAYGWISGAHAVQRAGAVPIFVDVEAGTGNIDITGVEKAINSKTRAIMPIHLYGKPCDVKALKKICDQYQLFLIEDCAQAHGAEVNGRKAGSFGDLAVFSFYPTKNLGCMGDGGAVVSNGDDLAESLRRLKNYGKDRNGEFVETGRNSRLDELQAAILNVKLPSLDARNEHRRTIARAYQQNLPHLNFLDMSDSVNYQAVFTHNDRDNIRQRLSDKGIETAVHYNFSLTESKDFPNSLRLSQQVVSLPVFPELTPEEISYICDEIKLI